MISMLACGCGGKPLSRRDLVVVPHPQSAPGCVRDHGSRRTKSGAWCRASRDGRLPDCHRVSVRSWSSHLSLSLSWLRLLNRAGGRATKEKQWKSIVSGKAMPRLHRPGCLGGVREGSRDRFVCARRSRSRAIKRDGVKGCGALGEADRRITAEPHIAAPGTDRHRTPRCGQRRAHSGRWRGAGKRGHVTGRYASWLGANGCAYVVRIAHVAPLLPDRSLPIRCYRLTCIWRTSRSI